MSFNFQNQMHPKTDEELLNIYYDFDQYQDEYLEIVSEEMEKRGIDFTNLKLRKQHKEAFMLELTEKGKPGDPVYITLGFISALFGGVLGIITGYMS